MAFFVRITGFDARSGMESFRLEPPWWPATALKDDPRMVQSVNSGYLDFKATLSASEARALHEQFRPQAIAGAFASASWQDLIRPMLAELDEALGARAAEFGKFEVCVMEWESGLG